MQAIQNKLVIGNDQNNPLFTFENDEIKSIVSDSSVSLVGEELYIDQLVSNVDYYVHVPYVINPADTDEHEYGPFSGDIVSFETDSTGKVTDLSVTVEPVQAGSGDPSPNNVRPISGWDSVNIWNKPTHDTTTDPTVTIQLGQTVYGGTLDVTNGTLTVDRAIITPLLRNVSAPNNYGLVNCDFRLSPRGVANGDPRLANAICNALKVQTSLFANTREVGFLVSNPTMAYLRLPASTITSVADANAWVENNACRVVYYLETPITINLDPVTISTLIGQNNVWSDAGSIVSLKYTTYGGVADAIMSRDGYIICSKRNDDIRLLPYGTKIVYHSGNFIAGTFYVKNVERVGRELYKINAVNAIGLLNRQYHRGGLYTGQSFQSVVEEILGNDYEYTIDGVVAVQRVYGWLPYDTKRKNLYQLLLAYGVEIVVGDSGNMFFTFPDAEDPQRIPTSRVFGGGKVIYDEPASRVEILEHSYHYDPTLEEVTLFDNTSDAAVEHVLVKFDQPINADTIHCSDGNLTISTTNTNYAVVSGTGVLSGRPYVHNTRLVAVDNENASVEKVVTVEDCTVVTFINADNVVSRLGEFYFNATRVEQDVNVVNEKPGRLYTTDNAFHELITGYITRMTKTVTSIARAQCRFVQNYAPTGAGMAYTDRLVIPLGAGASQVWQIPQAVFEKENPVFRVVLIGKGQDGAPGTDGEDGTAYSSSSKGKGGAGGLGGSGGLGGNIMIVTLSSDGLTSVTFQNDGIHSVLDAEYYHYSSADGAPNAYGYFDILTGELYAYSGNDGVNGGAGGNGDYYGHNTSELSTATDGENVEYEGVTYYGGKQRPRTIVNGGAVDISSNLNIYCSGAGGGGAAVGNNGGDASPGSRNIDVNGGAGADAIAPHPASLVYGTGGNGGHGGGGGGAGGAREWWNYVYSSVIATDGGTLAPYGGPGKGGKGSAGTAGAYGCAIIYY